MSWLGDSIIELAILLIGAGYALTKYAYPEIDKHLPGIIRRSLPLVVWAVTVGAGIFLGTSFVSNASAKSEQPQDSTIATLQSTINNLERRIAQLQRNNTSVRQENEALKREIEGLKTEIETLKATNTQPNTQSDSSEAQSDSERSLTIEPETKEAGAYLEFWPVSEEDAENPSALPSSSSIARLKDKSGAFEYVNFLQSGSFAEYEGQPLTLKWTGSFDASVPGEYNFYNSLYVVDNPNECERGFNYYLYAELLIDGKTVLTNSTYEFDTEDNPVNENSSVSLTSGSHEFEFWYVASWTRAGGYLGCYNQYLNNIATDIKVRPPDADVPIPLTPSDLSITSLGD